MCITSPTHMHFVVNASNTMTPGHLYEDVSLGFTIISAIDKRRRIPFNYYGSGSPFKYEEDTHALYQEA
jgi:hypothetical protein